MKLFEIFFKNGIIYYIIKNSLKQYLINFKFNIQYWICLIFYAKSLRGS